MLRESRNGAETHPCHEEMEWAVEPRDINAYCKLWDERERIQRRKDDLARYESLLETLDRVRPGLRRWLEMTAGNRVWTDRVRDIKHVWEWSNAHTHG